MNENTARTVESDCTFKSEHTQCSNPNAQCIAEEMDGYTLVHQSNGPDLGFNNLSGVRIECHDGYFFKVHGHEFLPYEDWRLSSEKRAADLAGRLTMDEIAGLMLYSPQNKIPMPDDSDSYDGKPFSRSNKEVYELSDGQKRFLMEDNVRHVLVSIIQSPEAAARWNNNVQALCEGQGYGIPANNSSDPRHAATGDSEFSPGSQGMLSQWSNMLGFAAMMDADAVLQFARIAREEYRALGLATALSPQADLGTDPRWYRYWATFGNDPRLVSDLTRAYAEGFQASPDKADSGWGSGSVNAMVKHWPGGGSGEGGRDAHYGNGKYAVYPGGCYQEHKIPFLEGAFNLPGATRQASAVMPYYTISYGITGNNVGNSFDKDIITGQLRGEASYDGVVCTDWCITHDQIDPGVHSGKPWGVETLTPGQRHYEALKAGVDQFGGNHEKAPVMEAYRLGVEEYGEEYMEARMRKSAMRLLVNIFNVGLFENPYVDPAATAKTVGSPEKMSQGFAQQLKSVVMLKNSGGLLPVKGRKKVWIPERHQPETLTYWRTTTPARRYNPVADKVIAKYFDKAVNADEADFAVVFIESPKSYLMGYDCANREQGGNGYIPITLQYRPYRADFAREHSIGADTSEGVDNRSYKGKWAPTINECDLDMVENTRKAMGGKPVVVVVMATHPAVLSEIEPLADAILMGFDVQTQVYMELIAGVAEPSALLPFELPRSMKDIELHCEDRPHDIAPYVDRDGNSYSFGFGLNFSGVISDSRTDKYRR